MKKSLIFGLTCLLTTIAAISQTKEFKLVTDVSSLKDGDEIILVNTKNSVSINSVQEFSNDRYLDLVSSPVEIIDNTISIDSNTSDILRLHLDGEAYNFGFKTKNLYINNSIKEIYLYMRPGNEDFALNSNNNTPQTITIIDDLTIISQKFSQNTRYLIYDNKFTTTTNTDLINKNTEVSIFKLNTGGTPEEPEKPDQPAPIPTTGTATITWPTNVNTEAYDINVNGYSIHSEINIGKTRPRYQQSRLRLYPNNSVTITAPTNILITNTEFFTNTELRNGCSINNEKLPANELKKHIIWDFQNPVSSFTLINGDSDTETPSSIDSIIIHYTIPQKKEAPTPITIYDELDNTIVLQIPDSSEVQSPIILYELTTDSIKPSELINVYNEFISLSSYSEGKYYLWANTRAEGYEDSKITYLGSYTVENNDLPTISYNKMTTEQLVSGHWYMISSSETNHFLGNTNDNGNYTSIMLNTAVAQQQLSFKQHMLDQKGILEFKYSNGKLIEKNTGKPLTATSSRASGTNDEATFEITTNHQHILKINGQQLGFNGTDFGFTSQHTQPILLYTTGSAINTAIDEVLNTTNEKPEYYNYQGIKIENPTKGMYIKRQGNMTTKVIIQ